MCKISSKLIKNCDCKSDDRQTDAQVILYNLLMLCYSHGTDNEMVDQELSCTIHLPSLAMICPVVFVLEC